MQCFLPALRALTVGIDAHTLRCSGVTSPDSVCDAASMDVSERIPFWAYFMPFTLLYVLCNLRKSPFSGLWGVIKSVTMYAMFDRFLQASSEHASDEERDRDERDRVEGLVKVFENIGIVAALGAAASGGALYSPADAIEGTNLFGQLVYFFCMFMSLGLFLVSVAVSVMLLVMLKLARRPAIALDTANRLYFMLPTPSVTITGAFFLMFVGGTALLLVVDVVLLVAVVLVLLTAVALLSGQYLMMVWANESAAKARIGRLNSTATMFSGRSEESVEQAQGAARQLTSNAMSAALNVRKSLGALMSRT
jgi:hypothetical protein